MKKSPVPVSFTLDQQRYMRDLIQTLESELDARIAKLVATDQVLLISPGKKIYAVSIDDTGVVTSTLVQG